jgi:TraY domain
VTRETRKALEWAAEQSGRSMSQEIELRLRDSLGQDRRPKPHIAQLGEAVKWIANVIEKGTELRAGAPQLVKGTGKRWLDDAFTAASLVTAIERFVLHHAPPWTPEGERDPAELGRDAAGTLITLIGSAADMPPVRKWRTQEGRQIRFPEEWRAYWRMHQALSKRPRPATTWDKAMFRKGSKS